MTALPVSVVAAAVPLCAALPADRVRGVRLPRASGEELCEAVGHHWQALLFAYVRQEVSVRGVRLESEQQKEVL